MKKYFFFLLLLIPGASKAQTINEYDVYLKPKEIPGLMGIQSFAYAQHDGKWLIIGGRLDGLHRRQPFAAFDSIGHNNQILVIDPESGQLWKAPVDQLPVNLRNQLKGTNICFSQDGDRLVLVGGYGINASADDHQTFPFLTTVNVPDLMQAVQQQQLNDALFHQVQDTLFAVTGGQLLQLENTFYLVGGHRFDGRYNPADRPTFTQIYTNSVRRFVLDAAGDPTFLPAFTNEQLMHRRDFNVTLQQNALGEPYITAFSGVFRIGADLPFLSAVHIDANGMTEQQGFRQYYHHYHCPEVPLFDPATGEMHTLFFGGIAQYEDSLGIMLQDNDVPFVRTVSRITRTATGEMKEYRFPVEMPALLGAGGEFIVNTQLPVSSAGIILFDPTKDSMHIGTILGGIASSGRNIFWINDDDESEAFSGMFDVVLVKSAIPQQENEMSYSDLYLHAVRHRSEPRYQVSFTLKQTAEVTVQWSNRKGKIKHRGVVNGLVGENHYSIFLPKKPGIYKVEVIISGSKSEQLYVVIPEEG